MPGAVLGVWHDGEVTVTPYGVLNTRTGQPTAADSVFQIGSITKTWTATMLAQLVAEGRAAYDATVADLLPGTRVGRDDASDRITVRHLLTHSSGVDGDIFDDTGRGDDCVEKYVELLADAGRTFEPGAAYSYCNSGYVLLGRIIEVLDGRTWDESLRERLVGPLGLHDTVTLPEEAILRSAAVGHHAPPHEVTPYDTWMLPRALGPAGLITASAADLLAYARLHLDGAHPAMWEPQLPIPGHHQFADIGLSWRVGEWDGTRCSRTTGAPSARAPGCGWCPSATSPCACSPTPPTARHWPTGCCRRSSTAEVGLTRAPSPEPDPDVRVTGLERHAGRYARRGLDLDVEADDGALRITVRPHFGIGGFDEPEAVTMLPVDASGDRFAGRTSPAESWWVVTFGTLPDGRAQLFSAGRVAPRDMGQD